MSFQSVLKKYRDLSFSEKDKGTRFERLMQAYLKTEPLYKDQLQHVWLWSEFPYRTEFGGKDTGIDLVAMTHEGDYWAIQCKCFQESAYIDKPAVDSFLATSSKTFRDDQAQKRKFSNRLWISTTNKWNTTAEETIQHQDPPVHRISLLALEDAPVDWEALEKGVHGAKARQKQKTLLPHQKTALDACFDHFKEWNRGRLIMACGTGKTFTSLKIAEKETNGKGLILFLVPSIALLGQTLREWSAQASEPLNAICVCSDVEVGKKKTKSEESDSFSVEDLALPATTNAEAIAKQIRYFRNGSGHPGMTVVFSTYQSIEALARAQALVAKKGEAPCEFDLVICDEAHRTTGVTLKGEDESAFVKVHDNVFLPAKKRLYMTATPRLYSEDNQKKAKEADALLCSMDDEAIYGKEVHRLGFGEAVEKNLLADYKVLVLTFSEDQIPEAVQKAIVDSEQEINTDDASKLIGCINALSKRMLVDAGLLIESDPSPMRRAVAFCQSIKISKKITGIFNTQKDVYYNSLTPEDRAGLVTVEAQHVDGTMGASIRDDKLSWLKAAPQDGNECRILTNVRCLSEGVDVPSLDAVLFLSARNSQIDVVQSVGRVMRTAKETGKKYGYIIIPVVIPSHLTPEEVLDDNERFKVVWTVLNALRAHDDRFNAMVNKLELNTNKPSAIIVGCAPDPSGSHGGTRDGGTIQSEVQKAFAFQYEQLQGAIYARMVKKVGDKRYWEQWAASVGDIAKRHVERINRLIAKPGEHKAAFNSFLADLRKNINPAVSDSEAVEMLAQHIITKPVFEALFENYSFVQNNPISLAMQDMVNLLEEQAIEKDQEVLNKFYESVRMRASGIDNAEGRQRIIIELYDKFFRTAFPLVVEKLGIVYTPVEVVDFIVRSVASVLKQEFDRDISDENVHVLDPFSGTGTFITRLLQCGLIRPDALGRKYLQELHANEIVLLAYYIASINIENVYHELRPQGDSYESFPGICLTDTFQLRENDDSLLTQMFPENSKRIRAQRKAPLRVILGNPPYSVGQKSANDNAQNQSYPVLEGRIEATYAKESSANLLNSLYNSYMKAFRWASDSLDPKNGGIVAFVTDGGWIDNNAMDGFRKCLEREFSSIYVFNLRGNQRTSGELSRREGGKIFGSGSRTPIAITILVKKPGSTGKALIRYHDIGDYLTREEKLAKVAGFQAVNNLEMAWTTLEPNDHGDWLNHRDDQFGSYIALGDKDDKSAKTFFYPFFSNGLKTNRDSWCYNASKTAVENNLTQSIAFYNDQVDQYSKAIKAGSVVDVDSFIERDSTKFTWDAAQKDDIQKAKKYTFEKSSIVTCLYRPFFKQHAYFNRQMNNRVYQLPKHFPTPHHPNRVICVSGVGVTKEFSAIITDTLPDLEVIGKSQCFPLFLYEKSEVQEPGLFDEDASGGYIRRDGLSDFILGLTRERYGHKVTKEDIFYYVYGFLHSPEYRDRYSSDLKKMIPRLPLVEKPADFWAFSKAGRELAELHINYESVEPYPLNEEGKVANLKVEKMRYPSKKDKTTIIYNSSLALTGIPTRAHEYVVNGRSALDWLMDRYEVKVHTDSKIKNDPNDWSAEQKNPRYIVDLIKRIVTVSLKTMDIIDSLPAWSPDPK